MVPITKNHCIVLHYIQTHLLKRGKLCQIHCQPQFSRQEIYEAAKLTKAEVTTFHRKAVDLIERASGSPMIFGNFQENIEHFF